MSSFFAEEGSDWFDQSTPAGDAATLEAPARLITSCASLIRRGTSEKNG